MKQASSDLAIDVRNLAKVFKLYGSPSDLLWEVVGGRQPRTFTALHDINLQVRRGETVGLIGRNGAGKSTLLRIIAGTLDHTSGELKVNGRVSAILELGTGFRGEYTGRENIITGGLCLGMQKEEIERKVDSIIEFSELEDFIDQPFRTYSTGMQARLTFATAVSVDPDILIIDEALSVGDAKFQLKCYKKMRSFQERGCAILMVSHDPNAITTLCDRAIFLHKGTIHTDGTPDLVTKVYFDAVFAQDKQTQKQVSVSDPCANGSLSTEVECSNLLSKIREQGSFYDVPISSKAFQCGDARVGAIIDFGILDDNGTIVTSLESGKNYSIFMRALFYKYVQNPVFSFLIRNARGVDVFGISSETYPTGLNSCSPGDVLDARLSISMWLTNGNYFLTSTIGTLDKVVIDVKYDYLMFSVKRRDDIFHSSIVHLNQSLSSKVTNANLIRK